MQCPLLIQVCDNDKVTATPPAVKAASRALHAELKRYPYDHWIIYVDEPFNVMTNDQLRFLTTTLEVRPI